MRRESSRAGWNFAALLLLIVVAGSAEQSFAQQVRLMEINEISGYVELLTEVARERRESRNSDVWNATDLRLSEIVQVNLFGSVYHPRFLTYEGGVGVNFGQTKHWDDDSVTTLRSRTERSSVRTGGSISSDSTRGESRSGAARSTRTSSGRLRGATSWTRPDMQASSSIESVGFRSSCRISTGRERTRAPAWGATGRSRVRWTTMLRPGSTT
jgi:hypothetical protein